MPLLIELSTQHLEPSSYHRAFLQAHVGHSGAIVSFTGLVRDALGEVAVTSLHLDHHPVITRACIEDFAVQAISRWALDGVWVVHRVGRVNAPDPIVFVATAAPHRRAAFEAADYLMDRLKQDTPFWKRESTVRGCHWVEPSEADRISGARWSALAAASDPSQTGIETDHPS